MFDAIYEKHNIPAADRVVLTRYFNQPNGIPQEVRPYFHARKWESFLNECLRVITDKFLARFQ